jgi:hypothetical protein
LHRLCGAATSQEENSADDSLPKTTADVQENIHMSRL